MSLLDRIHGFAKRPQYASKFEDPLYQALVADLARQQRHEDSNESALQDHRNEVLGSLATGGRGGLLSGPAIPEIEDEE